MSPEASAQTLEERCINTIRFLAVDAVQKANSGHPGMPMGAAAVAYTLCTRHLRFDPADPAWPDRDRFVLSAGHGSHAALLAAAPDRLRPDARRPQARSASGAAGRPATPSTAHTAGVETTTGPLGQGFANAVGMAVAERFLGAHASTATGRPSIDHFTYVLAGDGDMMEGISSEAASLAGHLGLGKLDRPLRRQPHHHRRHHRPRLHRGRRRALRGLRLARADGRRRQRRRGHRRGHRGGQGRDGQAVAHRRAHAHRLRLAQQAGHRRAPTARRSAPTRSS